MKSWQVIVGRILGAIPALALLIFGIIGHQPTWWEGAVAVLLPFVQWIIGGGATSGAKVILGKILGLVDPVALLVFGIIGKQPEWWQGMIAVALPFLMWLVGRIPDKQEA